MCRRPCSTTMPRRTPSPACRSAFRFRSSIGTRGTFAAAQAELAAAQQEVRRVQLALQQRLAVVFEQYATAQQQVEKYHRDILPNAEESLKLVNSGYRQGEFSYLMLLTAQRTYLSDEPRVPGCVTRSPCRGGSHRRKPLGRQPANRRGHGAKVRARWVDCYWPGRLQYLKSSRAEKWGLAPWRNWYHIRRNVIATVPSLRVEKQVGASHAQEGVNASCEDRGITLPITIK